MGLFQKKSRTVFIVFQDQSIRFVLLRSRSPLIVHKVGERQIPAGMIVEGKVMKSKALSQLLLKLVREWRLKGSIVQIVVPDSISVVRKISVPSILPNEELRDYIDVELGVSIHLPFDDPVIDVHKLRRMGENTEYLLFAVPEQVMAEYVKVLEEATLKPIDAEISSLANYRLFHRLDKVDTNQHYLLLNVDMEGINATAFHENTPVFTRYIRFDESHQSFSAQAYSLTALNDHDFSNNWSDMSSEIERIMSFYQFSISEENNSISSLIVIGDHPDLETFISKMKSRFEFPIIHIAADEINMDRGMQVPSKFYTAVGAGLKGE